MSSWHSSRTDPALILPEKPTLSTGFRLYLGSCEPALRQNTLKLLRITHILNVCAEVANVYEQDKSLTIKYKRIPIPDIPSEMISKYFVEAHEFIEEARKVQGRILVHCVGGVSRSATIVISYLMNKNNMSVMQAFGHVRRRRPEIFPNPGFLKQLMDYDKKKISLQTFNYRAYCISWLKLVVPNVTERQLRDALIKTKNNTAEVLNMYHVELYTQEQLQQMQEMLK